MVQQIQPKPIVAKPIVAKSVTGQQKVVSQPRVPVESGSIWSKWWLWVIIVAAVLIIGVVSWLWIF